MRQGGRGEEPHEGNAHPPFPLYGSVTSIRVQAFITKFSAPPPPALTVLPRYDTLAENPLFFQQVAGLRVRILACIFILCLAAGPLTGCGMIEDTVRFRQDEKQGVFDVPAVRFPACRERLLALLSGLGGIQGVTPDIAAQRLMVTYNSRLIARTNIEYAIADAGFDVDDSQGSPQARRNLPEPCR